MFAKTFLLVLFVAFALIGQLTADEELESEDSGNLDTNLSNKLNQLQRQLRIDQNGSADYATLKKIEEQLNDEYKYYHKHFINPKGGLVQKDELNEFEQRLNKTVKEMKEFAKKLSKLPNFAQALTQLTKLDVRISKLFQRCEAIRENDMRPVSGKKMKTSKKILKYTGLITIIGAIILGIVFNHKEGWQLIKSLYNKWFGNEDDDPFDNYNFQLAITPKSFNGVWETTWSLLGLRKPDFVLVMGSLLIGIAALITGLVFYLNHKSNQDKQAIDEVPNGGGRRTSPKSPKNRKNKTGKKKSGKNSKRTSPRVNHARKHDKAESMIKSQNGSDIVDDLNVQSSEAANAANSSTPANINSEDNISRENSSAVTSATSNSSAINNKATIQSELAESEGFTRHDSAASVSTTTNRKPDRKKNQRKKERKN